VASWGMRSDQTECERNKRCSTTICTSRTLPDIKEKRRVQSKSLSRCAEKAQKLFDSHAQCADLSISPHFQAFAATISQHLRGLLPNSATLSLDTSSFPSAKQDRKTDKQDGKNDKRNADLPQTLFSARLLALASIIFVRGSITRTQSKTDQ
jgi:hypothetical protein